MARQNLNLGSQANDGTGDTLRAAGQKINQNFAELYETLSGDPGQVSTGVRLTNTGVTFEGTSVNGTKTTLTATNPTAARTVSIPNASGNVVLDTATQTLTNKTLTAPVITLPSIKDDDASHSYNIVPGSLTSNVNLGIPSLAGNDTFVTAGAAQTLTNKTLTDAVLSSPVVQTAIEDTNGNELIKFSATASAVNEFTISNGVSGSGPVLAATGTSTNIDVRLEAKGTGGIINRSPIILEKDNTPYLNGTTITPTKPFVVFTSAVNIAVTLGDGTSNGQTIVLANQAVGVVTVSPTTVAAVGTSFTLSRYDSALLIWDATAGWYLISKNSVDNAG
jgi:hypothetical protein